MSRTVIGLTGGIGSGKSTVADLFVAQGAALVDTDAIAHELTAAGGAAMPALIAALGPEIATAEGALDRPAVRRRVFLDAQVRKQLECILHPMIRAEAWARCAAATAPYVILAVPLLVESGSYQALCDQVVVVDCPEDLQIRRVVQRSGLAPDEVRAIMAAQASRADRLAAASEVIRNDSGYGELDAQVSRLHGKFLRLSQQKLGENG